MTRGLSSGRGSSEARKSSASEAEVSGVERWQSLTWRSSSAGDGGLWARDASAARAVWRGRRSKTYPATPSSSVFRGGESPGASFCSIGSDRRSANSERALASTPPTRWTRTLRGRVSTRSVGDTLSRPASQAMDLSMLFVSRFWECGAGVKGVSESATTRSGLHWLT